MMGMGMNEADIIKIFQNHLRKDEFISEDVETFMMDVVEQDAHAGKARIVTGIDTLVESTDIPPSMELDLAARKSIVACVSDFAAKGVRPKYGVISVNIPRERASSYTCNKIAEGFKTACDEYDISIVGGDLNAGKEIVFSVCAFGVTDCAGDDGIITRRGAHIGDLLFVTGPFGHTAAGLRVMLGKNKGKSAQDEKNSFVREAIRSVTRPEPRLCFGLENRNRLSAAMDSSDGLSVTLNEMARQSQKKFVIEKIPMVDGLQQYAKSQDLDPYDMVFYGGEEYEFVFTTAPAHMGAIVESAKRLKTPIIEIGRIEKGDGVFVDDGIKNMRLTDSGWDHFG